jgi:hypothetical protein
MTIQHLVLVGADRKHNERFNDSDLRDQGGNLLYFSWWRSRASIS